MNYLSEIIDFMVGLGRFIILLGVLVFVHELGHFLAAKFTNVYVVRLSLGFGRRLFGFKRGETDYCISAIPLGGYVKMVGQEDMPRTQEEAERAEPDLPNVPPERRFDTQPARTKLAISFAGPFMNLIFAIPVLWVVFLVGIRVPIFTQHTLIGAVAKDSPAERAGIKAGQRVLAVDGDRLDKFEELQLKIWTNENKPLNLELRDLSGEITYTTVTPVRTEESTRPSIGIEPLVTVAINRILPDMPAERSSLKKGDIVLSYNHGMPDNESISKLIETVNESAGLPLVLTVARDEQVLDVTVVPEKVKVIKGVEFEKNIVSYVESKKVDSDEDSSTANANATGPATLNLRPGDIITAIDGELLQGSDVEDMLARRIYEYDGESVELTVSRPLGLFRSPQEFTISVPLMEKGMIGVLFSPVISIRFGPAEAFIKSFSAFGDSFSLTMKTLYYLVAGKVSTREMAGPIGIAFLTEKSLELGIGYYLNLVAFITINLAIINLLPIPVLDGGLIFITLIESLRRKPLDEKYLILLQRVGLAFILLLVLVVTYYDIVRAINHYFFGGGFLE